MAPLAVDIAVHLRSFELRAKLGAGLETLALVGPSGAGKTTILRAIAGLHRPDRGRITLGATTWFDSDAGIDLKPEERRTGVVFQDYALFPHMTVRENVRFAGEAKADELLDRFGIAQLAGVKPPVLSGGERQRVALARALARDPEVLLLDEPLAALDPHTRSAIRDELEALLATVPLPTILVTHDFRDAAALADRIAVLVRGEVRQLGTAQELIEHPADAFVATFTGANVVDGRAVHPWEIGLSTVASPGTVEGVVSSISRAGPRAHLRVGTLAVDRPADEVADVQRGDRVWLRLPDA